MYEVMHKCMHACMHVHTRVCVYCNAQVEMFVKPDLHTPVFIKVIEDVEGLVNMDDGLSLCPSVCLPACLPT